MRKIRRQDEILEWLPTVIPLVSIFRSSVVVEVLFAVNGINNPWLASKQLFRAAFGSGSGISGSEKK